MTAHLAHVQWATRRLGRGAQELAEHALADGAAASPPGSPRGTCSATSPSAAASWDAADRPARGGAATWANSMAELQRISPPLWGLAETALLRGDHDARRPAVRARLRRVASEVTDAAYLFPFLVTGVRAHLARGDATGARGWVDRVAAALAARAIPGTLPAIDHARGLLLLAAGDLPAAEASLRRAAERVAGAAPVLGGRLGAAGPGPVRRAGASAGPRPPR